MPTARLGLVIMIFFPLLVVAVQFAAGSGSLGSGGRIGIFANPNNAGLYAVALLAFFTVLRNNKVCSPIVYLGVGFLFGTLGLAMSVVLALLLSTGRAIHFFTSVLFLSLIIAISVFIPDLGNSLRIKPVLDSIMLLSSGRIDIETVTYGQLVQLLNTTDLSFLFRLKHWHNIMSIFANGNGLEWIFGFGSGATVQLSLAHLVPHNDYIRMLFEFGLVSFVGFLILILSIVFGIGRSWLLVPFLSVAIYFGTENLINNYIAMILFFFSAGALISQKPSQVTA